MFFKKSYEQKLEKICKDKIKKIEKNKNIGMLNKILYSYLVYSYELYFNTFYEEMNKEFSKDEFKEVLNFISKGAFAIFITDKRLYECFKDTNYNFDIDKGEMISEFMDILEMNNIEKQKFNELLFNVRGGISGEEELVNEHFSKELLRLLNLESNKKNIRTVYKRFILSNDRLIGVFEGKIVPIIKKNNKKLF